jgi:hypothetical protein
MLAWWTEEYLEGSGRRLFEVLTRHLPRESWKPRNISVRLAGVLGEISSQMRVQNVTSAPSLSVPQVSAVQTSNLPNEYKIWSCDDVVGCNAVQSGSHFFCSEGSVFFISTVSFVVYPSEFTVRLTYFISVSVILVLSFAFIVHRWLPCESIGKDRELWIFWRVRKEVAKKMWLSVSSCLFVCPLVTATGEMRKGFSWNMILPSFT